MIFLFIANMKLFSAILFLSLLCLAVYTECYGKNPLQELLKARRTSSIEKQANYYNTEDIDDDHVSSKTLGPVYVGLQQGRKQGDKIDRLLGQPDVQFSQYSGYVTVDPRAGRALFYYFVEAAGDSSTKPLVLWLNGGPGCSSMGAGAMTELGPFRVNPDGKSLSYNKYAWNIVSNVIFLESPAGVGFSYSNTSSDYVTGDGKTAWDSYTFLVNWLERFPEYKTRDFFITGESYAGHYVPQLAQLILQQNNNNTKHTFIKLKGFTIGNAYIDDVDFMAGLFDHFWTSALISDDTHHGVRKNCKYSHNISRACHYFLKKADQESGKIDIYNIYAPLCGSSSNAPTISNFDPCSDNYVSAYLNNPEVQKRLHVNITGSLPGPWQVCSERLKKWTDKPDTVLPLLKKLMATGIRVWMYSGDIDGIVPVTTTKYSIRKLRASVVTQWYPWYCQGEVGGYVVGYKNVTFLTIRGAGHEVPSYQPERALTFFSSFLQGKLPPAKSN